VSRAVGAVVAAAVAATTLCCSRLPPATPPVDVQGELVEAGCLAAGDDSGDFQQALASDAYPWLACLAEGGSVAGCGVPCE
jgi:hypothetical protein